MKKTRVIIPVALGVAAATFWLMKRAEGSEGSSYRFAAVTRGDLESTVSATGALSAVTTVQVGTQVSGQVAAIHVDFNDRVKKGQLIARIDPTIQQQNVREAEASLERTQADVAQSEREYQRNKQLYDRKVITESEFNVVEYALAVARSNLKSAQITLERARQNLAYTSIYAPIDGIVVERNVDVGQTVAASLSAPQLFLIANDLSRMQILASVDESDIGLINEGGIVRFTVQAYPDERFQGMVQQVRLQSVTTENVVNYTVVVGVENPAGKLLPGMTATVDFITGSAEDVFMVPNAALRFRPTEEMLASIRAAAGQEAGRAGGGGDSARAQPVGSARGEIMAGRGSAGRPANAATLWYVGEDGQLAMTRVRTGISDGQNTEVEGPGLFEGMQAIIAIARGEVTETGASSPFQTGQQGGRGFRPGGF